MFAWRRNSSRHRYVHTLYGLLATATQSEQAEGTGETEEVSILHVVSLYGIEFVLNKHRRVITVRNIYWISWCAKTCNLYM
jgi:hypothetical protein